MTLAFFGFTMVGLGISKESAASIKSTLIYRLSALIPPLPIEFSFLISVPLGVIPPNTTFIGSGEVSSSSA